MLSREETLNETSEMLTLIMNDDGNFGPRLLKAQREVDGAAPAASPPDWGQWLQYWNDADSVSGNMRKVEHWLQRARPENTTG